MGYLYQRERQDGAHLHKLSHLADVNVVWDEA
jgi:hypothetical protein